MVKELGNLDLETLGLWDLGIYLFMNHSESHSEICSDSHSESQLRGEVWLVAGLEIA